jgi:hypothetical protein
LLQSRSEHLCDALRLSLGCYSQSFTRILKQQQINFQSPGHIYDKALLTK